MHQLAQKECQFLLTLMSHLPLFRTTQTVEDEKKLRLPHNGVSNQVDVSSTYCCTKHHMSILWQQHSGDSYSLQF